MIVLIVFVTFVVIIKLINEPKIGPATIGPGPEVMTEPIIDAEDKVKINEPETKSQEKITISLPYDPTQPTNSVIPMGETIYHPDPPNPGGHPGIDYQWNLGTKIDILASAKGVVESAEKTTSHNKWDVSITTGDYTIVYAELENIDDAIKVGSTITLGQRIGEPGKFNGNHYNMHWELKNGSQRICPLSYFEAESKTRIENEWANTNSPELKANAPDICSGEYKD